MQQLVPLIGWRLLREPHVQNRQQLAASVTVSLLTITVPEKHDWHSFPETTWFEGLFPEIIFWATLWLMNIPQLSRMSWASAFLFFFLESLICIFVPWNQSPDSCRWMAEDTVTLPACLGQCRKRVWGACGGLLSLEHPPGSTLTTCWGRLGKIGGSKITGDGQGGLVCCDSWGRKELDTTKQLNWTELNWRSLTPGRPRNSNIPRFAWHF